MQFNNYICAVLILFAHCKDRILDYTRCYLVFIPLLRFFNKMENKILSYRIDKLLEESKLNAPSFARAIGCPTPQAIYDLLSGKTKSLSPSMQHKILSYMPEVNLQWLLTGEGEMLKPTEGVAPRDAVPLEDVGRQGNTDNTLDRLLTMMERLIEQGDRQTRVAEINAEANKQNSDNLARLIERWDAMQGNSLSHRQGVG